MRIYDRIMSDGYITETTGNRDRQIPSVLRTFNCERVICDNTADWVWTTKNGDWDIKTDTGPLRLPFDHMWFEWKMPPRIISGGEYLSPSWQAVGGLLFRADPLTMVIPSAENWTPWKDSVAEVIGINLIINHDRDRFTLVPVFGLVGVGEDGAYVQYKSVQVDTSNPNRARIAATVGYEALPALVAIGLMNCKNTITQEVRAAPMNRAQRKRGEARYSYRMIHVPGEPKVTTRANVRAAAGPPKAFHLVRGHFKTYTPENPLFGRRTGTYWWSWHGRGDTKAGVALHDYTTGDAS